MAPKRGKKQRKHKGPAGKQAGKPAKPQPQPVAVQWAERDMIASSGMPSQTCPSPDEALSTRSGMLISMALHMFE